MRLFTFFLFLFISITSVSAKDADKLNGTWVPVKQEMNGKAFPDAVIQNQKLIISDTTYTVVAESLDKGVIRYNDHKMDIYGKDGINKGQHFTAIYKYENDQLTICYNLKGDSYPESFETAGKKLFFLSVFKRDSK